MAGLGSPHRDARLDRRARRSARLSRACTPHPTATKPGTRDPGSNLADHVRRVQPRVLTQPADPLGIRSRPLVSTSKPAVVTQRGFSSLSQTPIVRQLDQSESSGFEYVWPLGLRSAAMGEPMGRYDRADRPRAIRPIARRRRRRWNDGCGRGAHGVDAPGVGREHAIESDAGWP